MNLDAQAATFELLCAAEKKNISLYFSHYLSLPWKICFTQTRDTRGTHA